MTYDRDYARKYRAAHKEQVREYHRRYNEKHPERALVSFITMTAAIDTKLGLVRATTCSECDSTEQIEGHHEDYDKPLEVVWLCHECHVAHHAKEREQISHELGI